MPSVYSGLVRRRGRRTERAGATGQPPQAVAQLLVQYPDAAPSWQSVQAQLDQEASMGLLSGSALTDAQNQAAQHFVDAFTGLTDPSVYGSAIGGANTSQVVGGIANAAASLSAGLNTAGGAVSCVYGLVESAIAGTQTPLSAVQLFTGTAVPALASAAAAAGAVTAGVGAAIVVGAEIIGALLGSVFGGNNATQASVCGIGLDYTPTITVGCAWSQGTPQIGGPGAGGSPWSPNASKFWRRFPDPNNAADAWWFSNNGQTNGVPLFNFSQTTWGPASDRWAAQFRDSSQRPIDSAFGQYHQLECDAAAAVPVAALPDSGGSFPMVVNGQPTIVQFSSDQVMLARFIVGYFAAWKANAEYALNGIQPKFSVPGDVLGEWGTLQHYVTQWNRAHSPGQGFTFVGRGSSSATADNQIMYPNACQGTLTTEWWFIQMLIQVYGGGAPIRINTGPKYTPPANSPITNSPHLRPIGLGLNLPALGVSSSVPAAPRWTVYSMLIGTAIGTGVGGPVGAAIGAAVGAAVGHFVPRPALSAVNLVPPKPKTATLPGAIKLANPNLGHLRLPLSLNSG